MVRFAAKASRSIAPVTSRVSTRRSASATAREASPVENAFELTSAMPSLARSSVSPKSSAARSAIGARSPWPSEPSSRTRGRSPSFSARTIRSAISGRTPEVPFASMFACRSIVARTISGGASGPVPMRWFSISRRLKVGISSSGIRIFLRAPTPVVVPYTSSPRATTRSTSARVSRMRSTASGASSTDSPSRATRTTSATVSPLPRRTTVMPTRPARRRARESRASRARPRSSGRCRGSTWRSRIAARPPAAREA